MFTSFTCQSVSLQSAFVAHRQYYNQLQKWWDTPTEKRPFLLQIAPGNRSVKYNTDLPPPIQSCSSKSWVWSCIASNFGKGWRGDHKHKIMDGPFMPKYGTVSQVLLQLVVAYFHDAAIDHICCWWIVMCWKTVLWIVSEVHSIKPQWPKSSYVYTYSKTSRRK